MADDSKKAGGSRRTGGSAPGKGGSGRSAGGSSAAGRSGSRPGTVRGANSQRKPSSSARPAGKPGTVRGANSRSVGAAKGTGGGGGGGGSKRPSAGGGKKPNYTLRRIIALLVLLLLLAAIVWGVIFLVGLISDKLSGSDEPGPTDAPTVTATAVEATPEPDPEPTPTELSTAQPEACAPEALTWQVTSSASAGNTVAGTPVTWELTFRNTSETACTVDFGPQVVVQTVTSGSDLIWSSSHCGSEEGILLLLGPGDSTTRTQIWDGTRSQEGCTPVGASPQPGNYMVTTEYGGFAIPESTSSFALVEAPPPPPPTEEAPPAEEAPAEG